MKHNKKLQYEVYIGDLPDPDVKHMPRGIVGVDIETFTSTYEDFADPTKARIGSIALWWEGLDRGVLIDTPLRGKTNLQQYFEREDIHPYFHFYPFDASFMLERLGFLPRVSGDTKLLAKIMKEPETSLYKLLEKYVTGDPQELPDKRLRTSDWALPISRWTNEMKQYALNDVRNLSSLHTMLWNNASVAQQKLYLAVLPILPTLVRLKGRYTGYDARYFGDLQFAVDYKSGCNLNLVE